MSQKTNEIINQLTAKLKGVTDEESIKKLTIDAWKQLKILVPNDNTFRRTRSELRTAIESAFPPSETAKPGYYKTSEGKDKGERYQHLALWYATTNEARQDVVGDAAREAYFANLPELSTSSTPQPEPQVKPQLQPKSEPKSQPKQLTLKDMTLQNLELDSETQEVVQNALNHSGMNLADFIKQACKVYARTVMGKAKQADSDLTDISTSELLNNPTYRTLPGRVEELARRAIQAIMHHNDMAPEKSQKWCITATAINALTGSKMALIKNTMEQSKLAIDDHNNKHGLNPYDNRGKDKPIQDDIDFVKSSVPDEKSQATPQATPETKPKTKAQTTTPVEQKTTSAKVITLPVTASTIEIHETLKANPSCKVRTKDGRKALTFVLTDKGVLLEETGEIEALVV